MKNTEESKNYILSGLNDKQKQAAQQTIGPVLIIAGAGSGKTKTITHRLAYLIASGVPSEAILAVTFTNRAAEEMKERAQKLLFSSGLKINETNQPFIGTFHRLGVLILKENAAFFNRPGFFTIFDEDDSRSLIKKCLSELDLSKEQFNYAGVREEISRAKSELNNPEQYSKQTSNFFQEGVAKVFALYEKKLEESRAFDFDDLIARPVELFLKNPDILESYQNRWPYIMVDEYQDTNTAQYKLISLLASKNRNLCVVGDDDQSIYSWRQADFRNFLNFDKDWPDAKIVVLEESYRLTKNILQASQEMIKGNRWRREKVFITNNSEGSPVFLIQASSDLEEADFAANMIKKMINGGIKPGEIAVLYRINAQSRVLEEAFLRLAIPYRIFAGVKFYERKEIKDLVAYCRLIANPNDMASLERIINVPTRGIGEKRFLKITAFGSENVWREMKSIPESAKFSELMEKWRKESKSMTVSALLGLVAEEIKYKDYLGSDSQAKEKWMNVLELVRLAEDYDCLGSEGLVEFLNQIALFQDADSSKGRGEAVQLMTLHSAKGLEFETVFIVGFEEGVLPHFQSMFSDEEMEEERRLAYVGLTRAKKEAYLIFAERRRLFGATSANPPSRFISEIPDFLVKFISLSGNVKIKKEDEDGIDEDFSDF